MANHGLTHTATSDTLRGDDHCHIWSFCRANGLVARSDTSRAGTPPAAASEIHVRRGAEAMKRSNRGFTAVGALFWLAVGVSLMVRFG